MTTFNNARAPGKTVASAKNIAIWVGIIGGGIGFFFFYGFVAELMR